MLGHKELDELLEKVYHQLVEEIIFANRTNRLNQVLEKYGFNDAPNEIDYIELTRAKILVVGDLQIKSNHLHAIMKDYDLDPDHMQFVSYEDAKTYPWESLKHSMTFTDVFIGPMPHKVLGIEHHASIISKIEADPHSYPRLHKLTAGHQLKITKNTFEQALKASYLLELTLR